MGELYYNKCRSKPILKTIDQSDLINWLTAFRAHSHQFGDLLLILEVYHKMLNNQTSVSVWPILEVSDDLDPDVYRMIDVISKYYKEMHF